MDFYNISAVLAGMDQNAVFDIINTARPTDNYLFARYLPEVNKDTFDIKDASMRIVPTMVGHVGRDSPYPPGGHISVAKFMAETAKLAQTVGLSEEMQIELYNVLLKLAASGKPTAQTIVNTVLNFADKVLGQAQLDTMEWLRGKALVDFEIDWTFGTRPLTVDYQIDSSYKFTARTGNDGYGGSASKFWSDIAAAKSKLKHNVDAFIAHPDTIEMIMSNSANSLEIIAQADNAFDLVRIVGTTERRDTDARYRVRLIGYGLEGEVLDPDNPKNTQKLPFIPTGKILAVGRGSARGFEIGAGAVGQGATPDQQRSLGYTHIAPTVEGKFRAGRWGRVYTPQNTPWRIVGDSVTNGLPVLQASDKLVVLTSDMV